MVCWRGERLLSLILWTIFSLRTCGQSFAASKPALVRVNVEMLQTAVGQKLRRPERGELRWQGQVHFLAWQSHGRQSQGSMGTLTEPTSSEAGQVVKTNEFLAFRFIMRSGIKWDIQGRLQASSTDLAVPLYLRLWVSAHESICIWVHNVYFT